MDDADSTGRVRPDRAERHADEDVGHDSQNGVPAALAGFTKKVRRVSDLSLEADDAADHEAEAEAVAHLIRRTRHGLGAVAGVAAEIRADERSDQAVGASRSRRQHCCEQREGQVRQVTDTHR